MHQILGKVAEFNDTRWSEKQKDLSKKYKKVTVFMIAFQEISDNALQKPSVNVNSKPVF